MATKRTAARSTQKTPLRPGERPAGASHKLPARASRRRPGGGGPSKGQPAKNADDKPDVFADPVIAQLTGDILQHHGAEGSASVSRRAEIGGLLLSVKNALPHGRFGAYLRQKAPFTGSTAERAINLHHFRESAPALFDKIAPLGIAKAYVLITLPAAAIEHFVSRTHRIPSTGAEKAPIAMTFNEMTEVLFANDKKTETPEERRNRCRRIGRRFVGELEALVDTATPDDRDAFRPLYADLERALGRMKATFGFA